MFSASPSLAGYDIYPILRRHRWKAMAVFACVMTLAAVIINLVPKTYRSQEELLVRLGRENAVLDPTSTMGRDPAVTIPPSREDELNSVAEIIRSRLLVEKVVDAVGPDAILDSPPARPDAAPADPVALGGPRQTAIRLLGKNLKVDPVKKSDVISIMYEAHSPTVAQEVLRRLVDFFLVDYIRLNRSPRAHEFLVAQVRQLRDGLGLLEDQLRKLKDDTGFSDPEGQRKILLERIGRVEDDLLAATVAGSGSTAEVAAIRAAMRRIPASEVTARTTGLPNEGTYRMREQFYILLLKEKEADAIYTAEHPRLQRIHEEVAAAKVALNQEEPLRTQVTTGPSKAHEEAQLALLRQQPLVSASQAKTAALAEQLGQLCGRLKIVNEHELQIARLRRDIDIQEANYRKYAVNLEQARIDEALGDEKISNIGVVQPATYDPDPVSPNKVRGLLFGFLLAVFSSVGVVMAAERRARPGREPATEHPHSGLRLDSIPDLSGRVGPYGNGAATAEPELTRANGNS
ncbi:MAG: GumC family protein [Thermoguttaceae bacterium]|jgi:uncharacterized protein involved in exopolysaccharide biosynthesis